MFNSPYATSFSKKAQELHELQIDRYFNDTRYADAFLSDPKEAAVTQTILELMVHHRTTVQMERKYGIREV